MLMLAKLTAPANRTNTTKSPTCVTHSASAGARWSTVQLAARNATVLEQYLPAGVFDVTQLAWWVPAVAEVLVMWAQPRPLVVKSFVNSLPPLVPVKLTAPAERTDTMKSPTCEVATGGPAVLLETIEPLAALAASGAAVEIPETSHSDISR